MTDAPAKPEITLEQLSGAYAMRAKFYMYMFDVLREEFGGEKAVDLIGEATFRLGEEMGQKLKSHGPANIEALTEQFLAGIPCRDHLFAPELRKCDAEGMEIQFHRCPLKDNWEACGREGDELEMLCRAAGAIDAGMFGAAGFTFKGETWKPGKTGCCRLVVEPGVPAE
nr:L-2-amino-thiazoline-4-carboxylic acid hydrolase [uncultured Celeribacter sp.]